MGYKKRAENEINENTERSAENKYSDGIIIKGVGGLYTVLLCGENGGYTDEKVECHARGVFRHEKITPYVGDRVRIVTEPEGGTAIDSIYPRDNFLLRPPVANIDRLFVVMATAHPDPELLLTDKMTAIAELKKIEPVIVITKSDEENEKAERFAEIYRKCGFDVFVTNYLPDRTSDSNDISGLLLYIHKKNSEKSEICALAGVSGAGKSTLLNLLFPELAIATGDISRKIERGKHTTRHVELYRLSKLRTKTAGGDLISDTGSDGLSSDSLNGFFADTPGFSLIDLLKNDEFTKEELPYAFREFLPYIVGKCRYTKCTHLKEDGCAVIQAVKDGIIPKSRHESFVSMYEEIKDKHEWDKKR